MNYDGDTIAAIATAPGRAGVAVVRMSGRNAFVFAARICGRVPEPGRFVLCSLRDPSRGESVMDEALVLAFLAPHNYTGEDAVEFQCHGGAVTPRRVLEACLAVGARLARRGEFTERALLNGRIDCDQAESVLDLVDAKTDRAADAAVEGLQGRRRRAGRELYDAALALSAALEHALDVDESTLPGSFWRGVKRDADGILSRIDAEIRAAKERRILRDGALVVLAGLPNAGKSSLMNALLGESRVLVSDTPGTTRDSVEAWLDIDGWPVRLVDTAGLRESADEIEAEGVERAERLIANADVVLDLSLQGVVTRGTVVAVHAKCDLGRGDDGVNVSALTGEGLPDLRRAIVVALEAKASGSGEWADGSDGLSLLMAAKRALSSAGWDDPVLAANAVREAAERLGELAGAVYSDDLIENLFSRFCVGK